MTSQLRIPRCVLVWAAAATLNGCCDNSDRSMVLIPWSSGTSEDRPLILEMGDSLPFSAEVTGRSKGPFVVCDLYDSRRSPERFDLSLSDSTVARIVFQGGEHYLIAVAPGLTRLTVSSPRVSSIDLTISILPDAELQVAGEDVRGSPGVEMRGPGRELLRRGKRGRFVSGLLCLANNARQARYSSG